ncbi:conserved protein, unknown function [Hepatocystis sp. ex Piliocolobus tephrosceles]|nr:conserved protein, unknown function [Hepatocystis sp. ex Piliocolobus tephrosceles]
MSIYKICPLGHKINVPYKKFFNIKCFSNAQVPTRVGFMKPSFKLNRKAQKYIVNVQWIKSTDTKELEKLCKNIRNDADSFNTYEIIDIVYYLSKVPNKKAYLTIEPLLFYFFRKYNSSVNLNGVAIHRLLRVLTEYQDLVYREWIYLIANIVSKKHAHISMRDIQLILDDLALFYDFQIHCHIMAFYNTIIMRIHELEVKRLPFLIHVIGRIGCSNDKLLKILYNTLKKHIYIKELYRSDFSGLLLRGLANLKISPEHFILEQLYQPVKDNINYTNIKYLSWCADGFSRLNYFTPLPLLVNQIIKMRHQITQLELNDFSSILNCIQSYILIKQYYKQNNSSPFLDENKQTYTSHQNSDKNEQKKLNRNEPKRQDKMNTMSEQQQECATPINFNLTNADVISHKNDTHTKDIKELFLKGNNDDSLISIEELYSIYLKLENIILEKVTECIYNSTPPYRVIMFELLTRLFRFHKQPIDLIINMNTHRYDTSLLLRHTNSLSLIISNTDNRIMSKSNLSFQVSKYNLKNEFFFNNTSTIDAMPQANHTDDNGHGKEQGNGRDNGHGKEQGNRRDNGHGKEQGNRRDNEQGNRRDNEQDNRRDNEQGKEQGNRRDNEQGKEQGNRRDNEQGNGRDNEQGKQNNDRCLDGEEKQNNDQHKRDMGMEYEQKRIKKYTKKYTNKNNEQNSEEHNEAAANSNTNASLPKILKNFLHSIFFRTASLGSRTIMLLLIALVRLNFGEREKVEYLNKVDSNILPFSKANEIYRPLTKCIIREVIRKVDTLNSEELIICTMCLIELDALNLNDDLFPLLIHRLFILYKTNYMSNDHLLQLKHLLQFLYGHKRDIITSKLNFATIKKFKFFIHL